MVIVPLIELESLGLQGWNHRRSSKLLFRMHLLIQLHHSGRKSIGQHLPDWLYMEYQLKQHLNHHLELKSHLRLLLQVFP